MWICILLTATDQASLALRRYAYSPCAAKPHGMDIHDARTYIGTAPIVVSERETWDVHMHQPPQSDPRWPMRCVCGYTFRDTDNWQLAKNRLYTRPDTGAQLTLREIEPGMMFDAEWYLDADDPWAGPDGRSLVARLPDGTDWAMDAPSKSGGKWERSGEPPRIAVRPSIASPGYHGWLTDGILSDDLEGRTY